MICKHYSKCFTNIYLFKIDNNLWSSQYYLHFTDEKTEAQRGLSDLPRGPELVSGRVSCSVSYAHVVNDRRRVMKPLSIMNVDSERQSAEAVLSFFSHSQVSL